MCCVCVCTYVCIYICMYMCVCMCILILMNYVFNIIRLNFFHSFQWLTNVKNFSTYIPKNKFMNIVHVVDVNFL